MSVEESGLRQRIAAAGIELVSVVETGSQWRGPLVGHVSAYTVTLRRDDGRVLTELITSGATPYEPDVFAVMESFQTWASLLVGEGVGDEESMEQAERLRVFVEGPATWEDWMYRTDVNPDRQDMYDQD